MTRVLFPCPPCEVNRSIDVLDVEVVAPELCDAHGTVRMTCPVCGTPITMLLRPTKWWEIVVARDAQVDVWRNELEHVTYLDDLGGAA